MENLKFSLCLATLRLIEAQSQDPCIVSDQGSLIANVARDNGYKGRTRSAHLVVKLPYLISSLDTQKPTMLFKVYLALATLLSVTGAATLPHESRSTDADLSGGLTGSGSLGTLTLSGGLSGALNGDDIINEVLGDIV